MHLETITMSDFKKQKKATIILPFGSIEAHGTHLPLGTDTFIAYALCLKAGEKTDTIVAPPFYYGVCRSTKAHPGTISISAFALRTLVKDLISNYVYQGFSHFLLFSGHAGSLHMAALKEVGEKMVEKELVEKIAILSILDLLDENIGLETKEDSHAGELETSLMLYLHPLWVKGEAKEDYPHFPLFLLTKEKIKYWPSAIWGNPLLATKEKGERFFNYLVKKLIDIIKEIKK
ncbi:MAG TPA: creatininase family protein [Candidatus Desulfofervidus auxilii]|uniref:Creatininase family protein n=1 Tax=Desulfofervidus auxilii TaxID=1621989 RepID=A0A7V0I9M8_DESA2|nr:creatininase family protein [Candidatus Desulfofervidus auxilii]